MKSSDRFSTGYIFTDISTKKFYNCILTTFYRTSGKTEKNRFRGKPEEYFYAKIFICLLEKTRENADPGGEKKHDQVFRTL